MRPPCTCVDYESQCASCREYAADMQGLYDRRILAHVDNKRAIIRKQEALAEQKLKRLRRITALPEVRCACGKHFRLTKKQLINVRAGERAFCSKTCKGLTHAPHPAALGRCISGGC